MSFCFFFISIIYGVGFTKTYRLKEHGSRRTAGAATCHLGHGTRAAGAHAVVKTRPRSRNVLWRTMFLHSALLGAGGHAAQLCCKRCAQAAQPAPLPRSGSAVLNHRPRTSHSPDSLCARRGCAWTSCSCMPAGPSITQLCKHDRPRDTATDGCGQAGERPRDRCRCVEARGAASGAAQRRRSGRAAVRIMTRCPRGTEGSAEAARTDAARKVDACAFSMLVSSYGAACAPLVSARVACLELVWLLHWCIS